MTKAFVGLGSNIGDGRKNLLLAWEKLGKVPEVGLLRLSSPYYSEPQGMDSSNWFTNAVGVIETSRSAGGLLKAMQRIEVELGRDRGREKDRFPDRTLDLDLLYYDDLVCAEPGFELPHPEIQNRMFVLTPLAEVAPEHRHPVNGQTPAEMIGCLSAGQEIRKLAWDEVEQGNHNLKRSI